MRRGEQSDAQAGCAINAFEHGAGGAFAVRAGDVDEAQFFLRIARERGEFEGVFQSELGAEQTQAVKKLDGFGVGHFKSSNRKSRSGRQTPRRGGRREAAVRKRLSQ